MARAMVLHLDACDQTASPTPRRADHWKHPLGTAVENHTPRSRPTLPGSPPPHPAASPCPNPPAPTAPNRLPKPAHYEIQPARELAATASQARKLNGLLHPSAETPAPEVPHSATTNLPPHSQAEPSSRGSKAGFSMTPFSPMSTVPPLTQSRDTDGEPSAE